ncbi:porin [Grimontia marina]|uniref:Porin-like protein H n=1 Tax=Grimontia marina TaxID=646534 RepID=A0A128F172_9GAMM|nr:porin [Grimontia marina]CZF80558.1 Porin-like protein H precursor [Grimontia marina]
MKKTLLAVAIPAVLLAGNVNAAEIYSSENGSVDFYGSLRAKLTKTPDADPKLDDGSSRAGLAGTFGVADNFDVFGNVEFSVRPGELKNRYSYIGANGSWGTVKIGKQYVTADDLWGVDNSYFFGGTHIVEGAVSGGVHDSAVRYTYENDVIYLDATYAFPEDGANAEVAELFGRVNVAGFDITAGVSKAEKFNAEQKDVESRDEQGNLVKTTYPESTFEDTFHTVWVERSFGDLYVGAQYASSDIERKNGTEGLERTGYALALSYSLSDKASVYGAYEFSDWELKNLAIDGKSKGEADVAYVGSVYKFNSYFRVYGEAAYVDGSTSIGLTNNKNDMSVKPGTAYDGEMLYAIGARVSW